MTFRALRGHLLSLTPTSGWYMELFFFYFNRIRPMVSFDILVWIWKNHLLQSYQITHSVENTKSEPKARERAKSLSVPSKIRISGLLWKFLSILFFFFNFIYLFLFVVDFVIHWNETAMGLHVFPILIPPPTSLSTRSLQVFPVHQVRALVSCIQPGLVICFTLGNIHVSMLFSWNIPPLPSPTESKRLFYKSVSFFFSVLHIGLSLTSF